MTASKIVMNAASGVGGGGTPYSLENFQDDTGQPYYNTYLNEGAFRYNGQVFFKPDGTRFYNAGYANNIGVGVFDLSTAWDIRTASHNTTEVLTDGTNNIDQWGVFLKSDGTKMYTAESSKIYEYALSTAWDITSQSYTDELDISAYTNDAMSLFLKPDGRELYIVDLPNDRILQYSMSASNAWDISTATYTRAFSVASEEASPRSLSFKSDGTAMFVTGNSGDDINKYDLSTAWDISTATHDEASPRMNNGNPYGLFIRDNGEDVYISGTAPTGIQQFKMTTAYDVSTLELTPTKNSLFFEYDDIRNLTAHSFSSDGTKLFAVCLSRDVVQRWNLTTGFDLSTATYSAELDTSSNVTNALAIEFKPDGTKMYIVNDSGDAIHYYTLSTAWLLSSATHDGSFSLPKYMINPTFLTFKPDGTEAFIASYARAFFIKLSLSTAWDMSTASAPSLNLLYVGDEEAGPSGIEFNSDGTELHLVGRSGDEVNFYDLSTAYDVTTATHGRNISISAQERSPRSVFRNGNYLFVVGSTGDQVRRWTITGSSIGTYNLTSLQSYDPSLSTPSGLYFKSDGTKMFLTDYTTDSVYEYDLSTAWQISSGVTLAETLDISANVPTPLCLEFKPDGTVMYVGGSNGKISVYDLSTAWDISTATHDEDYYSGVSSIDGMRFNDDGTEITLVDSGVDLLFTFTLTTAYDISTIQSTQSDYIHLKELMAENSPTETSANPRGLFFNTDGTKAIMCEAQQQLFEFDLSTAYDLSTMSFVRAVQEEAAGTFRTISTNDDGTKLFISDNSKDGILAFDL